MDEYKLVLEFCIDSPTISESERTYFALGWEHCHIMSFLHQRSTTAFPRPVHKLNEFRLRHLITQYGRTYKFTPLDDEWMTLEVGPPPELPEQEEEE